MISQLAAVGFLLVTIALIRRRRSTRQRRPD
jgi:hypothetical protein